MNVLGLAAARLPSTWSVVPAGYLFRRQKRVDFPEEQLLSVYRDYGVVPKDSRDDNFNKASEDLSAYQLVEPNDLVINKMKAWQGSVGISAHRGIVSPAYFVASPTRDFFRRYVHYLLRCSDYLVEYQTRSAGIRVNQWDLDWDDFRAIPVALPPIEEQERIANFLDEQTSRIDALIAEKEALHVLVEEEMQACVDRAALGGIEPNNKFPFVPDSQTLKGVRWSRCMLKHKWRVTDCKHLTVEFRDEGYPLASIREVSGSTLDLQNAKRASETDYQNLIEGGRRPSRGDLIYARNASVGAAALVDTDEPFSMGQDVCLITSEGQDQAFLRLQLMSSPLKAQLESLLQGATIRRINVEQIRSFAVFVPPVSVQREVVGRAAEELKRRADLQRHIADHIGRLREYRSSLISAAVTGQLNFEDALARKAA